MMKRLLNEEGAWERFLELHAEDEESKEHASAVEAYLEEHPEDEDLAGFENWIENWTEGFVDWYERADEYVAQERTEHRLNRGRTGRGLRRVRCG
jgi:hypothetical protein